MDPLKNPFSPGAGSPPPELSGRQPILDRAKIAFARLKSGKSEKSFLLVGLRGVGKTVLLNEIHKLAESAGYKATLVEAHEKMTANTHPKDPLHGMTLEKILTFLVEHYGWQELGRIIDIRCFNLDPSMSSSLKFLRRNPWAREHVENLYVEVVSSKKTTDENQ